jgi:ADP-heptose:LPS heptosyltransferase
MNKEINDREVRRILILQLGGIGDLVLCMPAIVAIRRKYNRSYIALLVMDRSAQLISGSSYMDEVFALNIQNTGLKNLFFGGSFFRVCAVIMKLRRKKFDMSVNLENIASWKGALKMALLFWIIGSRHKVGRDTDRKGFFLNMKSPESLKAPTHEVNADLKVASLLNASLSPVSFELPISEEHRRFVKEFLKRHNISDNDTVIGFNPGGFHKSKRWPNQNWSALAHSILKEFKCKIIITEHKNDLETIEGISTDISDAGTIIARDFNLKQLAALTARFDIFITNDSGPMHIAAAMGIPVIALFGPQDPNRFSPCQLTAKCIVLQKQTRCKTQCNIAGCRKRICMKLITVEDVLEAIRRLLG